MKALKIILITIITLIALILLIGLFAPKKYKVERSIDINAPLDVIMDQVSNLRNVNEWSPWSEYDPDMKSSYSGTDGEVGSSSEWQGNKKVGKGKQEITKITENRVETKITFIEPWESVSSSYIQCDQEGAAVKVTWGFEGKNPYPWNALCVFMSMDKMLGKEFEKGLKKLKERCENPLSAGSNESYEINEMDFNPMVYIAQKGEVSFNEIGKFYNTHLPALYTAVSQAGIKPLGAPTGLYFKWDEKNHKTEMAAAIPVSEEAKVEKYEKIKIPGSKALYINYYGPYENMEKAHYAMDKYMKEKDLKPNELVIEEYITDPVKEADTSKWLTKIIYLIK